MALLLVLLAAVADAQAERQQALTQVQREMAGLELQLAELGSRVANIESSLTAALLERTLQERRLDEATLSLSQAESAVQSGERSVAEMEQRLERLRVGLRRRFASLYRYGGYGYLRLFLSVAPQTDTMAAIRQLRYMIRRDGVMLQQYREGRRQLRAEQVALERNRDGATDWLSREQVRAAELEASRRRLEQLLDDAESRERSLRTKSEELLLKQHRIVRLIESLETDGALAELESVPIQDFRGALDWPISGPVTIPFGPRRDPQYQTSVPHNGIELEPAAAAPVRAVYGGKVLYADHFEGFGFTVVVQHLEGVLTLYAGLSELLVVAGDVVSLGTPVGAATERLYFEVRVGQTPEDPTEWLH